MTDRGWCPFARQHRGPGVEGPSGYPEGTQDQNHPILFVDHRMGGYKRTLDDDQWRHDNGVGVHFGIGRDGSIDQYTDIFDASWGNGVSGSVPKYDRANASLGELEQMGSWVAVTYAGSQAWALVAGGVNVLNSHSISTEHEDEAVDQPWTQEMIDADIRVKRWCLEELDRYGMPMPARDGMLAGHFQIDAINRPNCPGDNWPRAQIIAGITEGEETMKIAPWWTGRKLQKGTGEINLNVDFGPAAAYELCIVMAPTNRGQITFKHGDFKMAAAVISRAANFVLVPGQFGTAPFEVIADVEIAYLACASKLEVAK